jgi:hypothetical protein
MDRYGGPQTTLTIALLGGLYISILMDRYRAPNTAINKASQGGLFVDIIMDCCGLELFRGLQSRL